MKKTYVLMNDGLEEIEALTIVDYLRRSGIDVKMVSMQDDLYIKGGHDIVIKGDLKFDKLDKDDIELLFIPGGTPAAEALSNNEKVLELVKYLDDKKTYISALCAGPLVLESAKVISDKEITSYPGFDERLQSAKKYVEDIVVESDNIITSRGPATAVFLALKLIEILKGKDARTEIEDQILYKYIS